MTISNENVKQIFNGDGANVAFPFNIIYFKIQDTEIKVYLRDESVDPVTEVLQTLTGDYTMVDGSDDGYRYDGGTITMLVAPTLDQKIIVKRELLYRQDDFDPAPTSSYKPEEVEVTFDRDTAKIQQLNEELERTIKVTSGSEIVDTTIPDGTNKFIKINAAGTGFELEEIDLDTLQAQVDGNTSDTAVNAFGISTNANEIAANDLEIAANAAAILANTGLIGDNSASISTNATGITTNTDDISLLKSRIGALESFLGTTGDQSILNNTGPIDLTDFLFDGAINGAVNVEINIARKTDTDSKYASLTLSLVFSEETGLWRVEKGIEVLDYAGVTFDVVTGPGKIGQVNYTSNDLAGTSYAGKIFYNIKKFGV